MIIIIHGADTAESVSNRLEDPVLTKFCILIAAFTGIKESTYSGERLRISVVWLTSSMPRTNAFLNKEIQEQLWKGSGTKNIFCWGLNMLQG